MYPHLNKVDLSESPFSVDLSKYYPEDKFQNIDVSKDISSTESNEIVFAENIHENYDLLKLAPSVWTKIYKRDFFSRNNLQFQQSAAEDAVFVLNAFLKANGIVFLNNYAGYVYYKYDSSDNASMTNNVSFKLLNEVCESYITCGKLARELPKGVKNFYVSAQIWSWFGLWRNSNLTKVETDILIKKLKELKSLYDVSFKTELVFIFIIYYIKFSSYLK